MIMADSLIASYHTYVRRVQNFLFLGGILPSATVCNGLYHWSPFLPAFSCFVMACGLLNFTWYNIKNLNLLTKTMSLTCSLIATSLRTASFSVKRTRLLELYEILEDLFKEELTENSETKLALVSSLHGFDKPAYIYCFLIGSTLFMYFISPLSFIIRSFIRHEQMEYVLPFVSRFPWSTDTTPFLYYLHLLFQSFVAWFLLFTNSGVDALFGFHMFQMSGLLRAMSCKLKNSKSIEEATDNLKNCIRKHQRILHCRDILQDVYGPIIVWLVLTNGIVICALIFQASQMTHISIGRIALFGFYMFLKLVQTFTYAWYGTVMKIESEAFCQSIYFSNWMNNNDKNHNRYLRINMLIMMQQRPITLTASHFFFVSIDMFIKIMNTAISYFFLLQTLDEKE